MVDRFGELGLEIDPEIMALRPGNPSRMPEAGLDERPALVADLPGRLRKGILTTFRAF